MKYLKNQAEAEDAVMEIFEKLHLDLKKGEIGYFKAWLYAVARNHCLMKLRKAGLIVEFPEDLPPIAAEESDFDPEKEASLQQLEQALPLLKAEQRTCIDLFYLQEQSYKQVAAETGFTLNEVKTHIQNGKANLKKISAAGPPISHRPYRARHRAGSRPTRPGTAPRRDSSRARVRRLDPIRVSSRCALSSRPAQVLR